MQNITTERHARIYTATKSTKLKSYNMCYSSFIFVNIPFIYLNPIFIIESCVLHQFKSSKSHFMFYLRIFWDSSRMKHFFFSWIPSTKFYFSHRIIIYWKYWRSLIFLIHAFQSQSMSFNHFLYELLMMEVILQYLKLLSYNYTIDANHQSAFQIDPRWVLLYLQEFWDHTYFQLVYNQECLLALTWYNTQSRIFLKSLRFIRSSLQDLEWILMHFLHRPYEQDVVEHWTVFSYTNNYLMMILSGSTQNFSAIWSIVSSSFGTGSLYSVFTA